MVVARPTEIHIQRCPWQQRICELGHSPDGEAHFLSTWTPCLLYIFACFFRKSDKYPPVLI